MAVYGRSDQGPGTSASTQDVEGEWYYAGPADVCAVEEEPETEEPVEDDEPPPAFRWEPPGNICNRLHRHSGPDSAVPRLLFAARRPAWLKEQSVY